MFFLSLAGHNNPNWSTQWTFIWVMLYCYILLLFFFPMVIFSWLSQSTRRLLTPAYPPFCFSNRRYVDLATSFFISSWRVFTCIWGLKITVKQQNIASVPMRPPLMLLIHLRGLNELRPSASPWSVSVPDNRLREACCMPMTFACTFLIFRVRLSVVWPCKCHLTFSRECSDDYLPGRSHKK